MDFFNYNGYLFFENPASYSEFILPPSEVFKNGIKLEIISQVGLYHKVGLIQVILNE